MRLVPSTSTRWSPRGGTDHQRAPINLRISNPPPQSHQPPQQWHQPPQQWHPNQSWQQRQPANHQWGGAPQHPAGNNNNAAGFSGHTGYKGGFSGHDGRGNARGAPNRPRSNYSATPRLTGRRRAAARIFPGQKPAHRERHVRQEDRPAAGAVQAGRRGQAEDARLHVRRRRRRRAHRRQPEPPGFSGNAQPHAHEMPIDLDHPDAGHHEGDYGDIFGGGTAPQSTRGGTQNGSDSRTPASGRRPSADAGLTPGRLGTPNSQGLVPSEAGVMLDPVAAQTYVYPAQLVRRDYQYRAVRRALDTNSLVCLPTGLGKTLIAAVVMYNFYRWFPQGKVVFLAPTRPLVDQQKAACSNICGIPTEDTCTMMGSTKKDESGTRRTFWRTKRVFFCTPQTMENDINSSVCPANEVVCVVIDEAHRAKGNHSYVGCIRMLWDLRG